MISGRSSNMPLSEEGTSSLSDEKDHQLKKFIFECKQTNERQEILIPEVRKN